MAAKTATKPTLTINAKDLQSTISALNPVVNSRPSHPILTCFLIELSSDGCFVTASDLSIFLRIQLPAEWKSEPLKVCVTAKLFSDAISRLKGELTLTFGEKLIIKGNGKYELHLQSGEDFPELPAVEAEPITIPAGDLSQACSLIQFASTEESKQVLTGVHFGMESSAATDGHRLAVLNSALVGETAITIPSKALQRLEKLIQDETDVTAQIDLVTRFQGKSWTLTTRLLEGQYPNYPQLIPKQFKVAVELNRAALIDATECCMVIADLKNNILKFEFGSESLRIVAEAADVGDAEQIIDYTEAINDPITIAFNGKYLLDALKAIQSDVIKIQMNTPTSPAVLEGERKDLLCLIMPVQVRS